MKRLFWKASKKVGLAPGELIHVGERKMEDVRFQVIDFDSERFEEKELATIEECFPYKGSKSVTWINIHGLHDTQVIEKVGKQFGLHPLVMEDILDTRQRPKIDDYTDYAFMILKMISFNDGKEDIESEQVSMILGKGFVITFQERPGDVFGNVRERIRKSKGRVRREGCDYLAYALLDAIVDNYFIIIEKVSEKIEEIETSVMSNPTRDNLNDIHRMKMGMTFLRKSIWPLREVLGSLSKGETNLVQERVEPYFRDLYDHTIQVTDAIDTFRDMLSGMLDVYLSSVSNRMNEIMKVLTIFAAIFIPLTFIAGVYGMNFEYMPELKWRIGYPVTLAIMAGVAIGLLFYFRKKRWLGKKS